MLFEGLDPNEDLFVQVLGGDAGWTGDIEVLVNGTETFDWLGVADSDGTDTASLFGFYTQADATGNLDLLFTVPNGNFAGISGLIISSAVVPEPSSIALWTVLGLLSLLGMGWKRWKR